MEQKKHLYREIKIAVILFSMILFFVYTIKILLPQGGLLAIDVSHHNNNVRKHLMNFEPSLLIAKASEGETFKDPKFDYHYRLAKDSKTNFGAYHFLSFDKDINRQFQNYLQSIKLNSSNQSGYKMDIKPILDVENNPGKRQLGYNELRKMIKEFGALCYHEFGCYPIIYCDEGYRLLYFLLGFDQYLFWTRNTLTNPLLPSVMHQYKEDHELNLDFNRIYDLTPILLHKSNEK